MRLLALYLFGLGLLHADSPIALPSPNGKFRVAGNHSDLFIVDAASGKKLCPLLPASQQGQLGNVDVEASWSPDSRRLAVCVFYGTRMNELLYYSISGTSSHLVKVREPDLSKVFPQLTAEDDSTMYDDNSLGQWVQPDTIHVTYGTGKTSPDGNSTQYFLIPAYATISKGSASIKLGKPAISSDQK